MKVMGYAEFSGLPEGTIFGQVSCDPDQFSCGIYRKGRTWPEDHGGGAGVSITDLIDVELGFHDVTPVFMFEDNLRPDHLFVVYEPADVDRLVSLICKGDAP